MAVRRRAGVVTNAGAWYGPGSAEQREGRCAASGTRRRATFKAGMADYDLAIIGGGLNGVSIASRSGRSMC
jgi:hypothetical protein